MHDVLIIDSYRLEIERMQAEVLDYLLRPILIVDQGQPEPA